MRKTESTGEETGKVEFPHLLSIAVGYESE